ncbi:lasso peptide biosynthesis PqqD family chaperone [Kitasatospora sp. NPDC001574]
MSTALAPAVRTVDTETGTVLLHERTGRYWQLNPTGAAVLRHLLDGATPQEAARRIAARHPDIPAEQAERDVAALIEQLHDARLVTA